jgi:23S rRNA pseudouridine2605 synthase
MVDNGGPDTGPDAAPGATPGGERIAKVIARAGLCSRREAEVLVAQGRVALDGHPVEQPGTVVRPGQRVTVDGEALPALEPPRHFRFHTPAGLLTAARDPAGRPTISDRLPANLPRLMPVGRLDLGSEGLLLLTNDGGLKRYLELPATGWLRRYRARVHGQPDRAALAALAKGVTVAGVVYGPIQATLERQTGANAWVLFALREGRNREVRRVCEHLGLQVNRLIRIAYGPFQLGALKEGAIEEVPGKVLREQLGRAFFPKETPEQKSARRRR